MPEGTEMVTMTVREALRDAMAEEMRRDGDVFVMGEEVAEYQGAYKITQGLLQEFGARRVIDTPITEHGFAGIGVGAALAGLKPIVEFMTFNFAMQAIDQIINSAAKTLYMSGGQMGCSIVFRGPNGAAARVAAQHSQDYSSWYSHIPGLKVIAPYSAADAKGLLKAAIRDPNPVIFLENEILYGHNGQVPKLDDYVLPIGKARIARKGKHVTLVAWSNGMTYALKAADELAKENIEAEVIDLRTLRPLDTDTDHRFGEEDRPHRHGGGGLAAVGRRRGDFRARRRARVRLARRAAGARVRQGRADALCGQPGEAGAADRGGRRRGREGRDLRVRPDVDDLVPPSDLPGARRGIVRLWNVNGDPRSVRHGRRASRTGTPEQVGEVLAIGRGRLPARARTGASRSGAVEGRERPAAPRPHQRAFACACRARSGDAMMSGDARSRRAS